MRTPKALQRLSSLPFPYGAPTTPTTVEPRRDRKPVGAEYDTAWARRPAARWARVVLLEGVLNPVVGGLAKPEHRGLDRLEALAEADPVAPLIFAANHHSHIDSALILTSLPEPWRHRVFVGAAADYFFTNRMSSAASALALNAIPIERTGISRRSVGEAEALLRDRWSLVLFPEGGRSPDGWGQPHKGGAAWLAERAGVAVVPIHIAGTGRILAKGDKRPKPGRSIVTFGAPMRCDDATGEGAREFAVRIEQAIEALADESNGDWYAARRRAHAGQTPSLAGPADASWRRVWALGDRKGRASSTPKRRWPDLT
ncbi:MAG: 1-acyl-sn-glycerol-3-phosphate acyltransferase [Acidimicrobiia bacterium]|nr:1-acyl-sn-glycerol-3-phosphate acyltransferase [Acidimicrobiia bacterium]